MSLKRRLLPLPVGLGLTLATAFGADPAGTCFEFDATVREPLRPPIPMVEGRDNSAFGTYPDRVDWAAGRAVLDMPVATAYEKFLDHRNVKDMTKTTLVTRVLERPNYLAFHLVDVAVRLRALFLKMTVTWTEAWAYSLVEGTSSAPARMVISYEKVAGTGHIERQCGSYVLQARTDGTTDLSMYEEVKADRRSAKDTRDMHAGILRNLRAALPSGQ